MALKDSALHGEKQMEKIVSKKGDLTWNIVNQEKKPCGKQLRAYFTVACSKCGYRKTGLKINIQRLTSCPGCSSKPAAVKTDQQGMCISICDIGMVEFVREYQERHNVSERAAVRQFIETVKAHLPADDPILDDMTEESVNSKIRRLTGKKKDKLKSRGGSPQKKKVDVKDKKFSIKADPKAIQDFLTRYLPDYRIVKIKDNKARQQSLPFNTLQKTR